MGCNQYWAGRVYDLCVYFMTGTPEVSTESGFMEKPGVDDGDRLITNIIRVVSLAFPATIGCSAVYTLQNR